MHSAGFGEPSLCDSLVDNRRDESQGKRAAGAVERQPGNLHTNQYGLEHSAHPVPGKGNLMNIDFPFDFDGRGRTAETSNDDHIRDMIEQFLFTNAGERVNRPDFGSGILQLIFAPNSPELAAALQFTIQAGLQQWLAEVIEVHALEVTSEDSSVRVDLQYIVRRSGEQRTETFIRESV